MTFSTSTIGFIDREERLVGLELSGNFPIGGGRTIRFRSSRLRIAGHTVSTPGDPMKGPLFGEVMAGGLVIGHPRINLRNQIDLLTNPGDNPEMIQDWTGVGFRHALYSLARLRIEGLPLDSCFLEIPSAECRVNIRLLATIATHSRVNVTVARVNELLSVSDDFRDGAPLAWT